ncbi:gelsolin [Apiospora kogelbergensis]|uniref:gelsolin n=1 Tax=Apiospora kogelbergensis TaxID=1337665 RepID=UPI00312E4B72
MSEDVSKFLSQVRELGDRHAEEDEARSRELEEKILQDRKERQARRAEARGVVSQDLGVLMLTNSLFSLERARSISPQKSSPANTPPPSTQRTATQGSERLHLDSSPVLEPPGSPQSPRDLPTLDSMFARAENAARSSTSLNDVLQDSEDMSRDQIAQSLSSKDPSWFRQTADRGSSSGAYRKNQVEDDERTDMTSPRTQLPGMSRGISNEAISDGRSSRPESLDLRRGSDSPLPLAAPQKLTPPGGEDVAEAGANQEREPLMSPPVGTRLAHAFRQASLANQRNGWIRAEARPKSMMRETPTDTYSRPGSRSRPTSSYGREEAAEDEPISSKVTNSLKLDTKPSPEPLDSNPEKTPPETPSKSADPRRWSPTKASWLESALNKPESPKPKLTSAPSNQPAWMAEIAKAKAQKATNSQPEVGRSNTVSHKHEVSIGGLSRSFAPGIAAKPTTPTVISHRTGGGTPMLVAQRTGGNGGIRHKPTNSTTTAGEGNANEAEASSAPKPKSPPAPVNKPRSDTLPTRDFRASLKPRQAAGGSFDASGNPEFKNVFGHLRKATTQNYVAPDELKNNITRGKASLNVTGGPKKTERVDEFKEAILAKKKEFQQTQTEGRGISRNMSNASENPIPEGLAKSLELARSKSIKSSSPVADREKSVSIPDLLARRASRIGLEKAGSVPDPLSRKSSQAGLDADQESPKPAPLARNGDDTTTTPTFQKETSAPGRLQGKIGGGLANRFNPALAGLLARGPPPMSSGSSSNGSSAPQSNPSATDHGEGISGPKLTHMTKGRARGPRRKAPTTASAPAPAQRPVPEAAQTQQPPTTQSESTSPRELGKEMSPTTSPKPDVKSPMDNSARPPNYMQRRKSIKEQVAAFSAPEALRRQSDPMKRDANQSPQREAFKSPELENAPKPLLSKPSSPELKSPPPASPSRPLPQPIPSPMRVQPAEPEKRPEPDPARGMFGARPLPTSPSKHDTRAAKPAPPPLDLDVEFRGSSRPLPNPQVTSPPLSGSPMRSPSKHAMETSSALTDFFGTQRPKRDYRADAAELLMNRPSTLAPQIRTLDTQMFQISADGKKVLVRAGHERHLFEGEMYLCSHTFSNESGKKTSEVYFWAGCEVPGPVVEDAAIFVSREARSLGGNLIKFRQGKETPEFLAALGGIVITQRGSSMKYDSLAPRILCGRRYMGQIVFDEVDFLPVSLCSGFPYLITASGRCHLWKGKGSGVDELSCARLVGMEYALSGELEEIEDGHEPDNFWALFEAGTAAKAGSADHWRLKPNYEKYCSRLFMSDAASKQQIVEVCPFSQSDLQSESVYVLDAFFELYIIVGKRAQSQYASFHNALDFAQEYGILAAGMEDRPFVPISTVVLEGIPRDMKSVFRRWQDADSPTLMPPPTRPGLRRGRSLRVLPLNQALQAMSE